MEQTIVLLLRLPHFQRQSSRDANAVALNFHHVFDLQAQATQEVILPLLRTATAESAKTLNGLVTVNNANKIATRLVR
jgi:hypothetical protein